MEIILNHIDWVFTIMSLAGNLCLIFKKRYGWLVWIASNVGWTMYFYKVGEVASAFLFMCYLVLAVWGYLNWKDKK